MSTRGPSCDCGRMCDLWKRVDELQKRIDAELEEQECEEKMQALMHTEAQRMVARLADLYKFRACTTNMIEEETVELNDVKVKFQQPGTSTCERNRHLLHIRIAEDFIKHRSESLQTIESQIEHLENQLGKELADQATAQYNDERRKYFEKDPLEQTLDKYYSLYKTSRKHENDLKEESKQAYAKASDHASFDQRNYDLRKEYLMRYINKGMEACEEKNARRRYLEKIHRTKERIIAKKRR